MALPDLAQRGCASGPLHLASLEEGVELPHRLHEPGLGARHLDELDLVCFETTPIEDVETGHGDTQSRDHEDRERPELDVTTGR